MIKIYRPSMISQLLCIFLELVTNIDKPEKPSHERAFKEPPLANLKFLFSLAPRSFSGGLLLKKVTFQQQ
jgi:hypothetical protein